MKNLSKILLFLALGIIGEALLYLAFAFIAWDWSWACNGGTFDRFIFILLSICVLLICSMIVDKKK